jgi:hypothetical protein
VSNRAKVGLWLGVWALTRLFMVAHVGFWDSRGTDFQDVNFFHFWSDTIAVEHRLPTEPNWQYPPGAAFLMLVPRIGGGEFDTSFVVTMLAVDLVGLGLVVFLARRGRPRPRRGRPHRRALPGLGQLRDPQPGPAGRRRRRRLDPLRSAARAA